MKATLVEKAPSGDDWLFEIKWDGYRAVAVKNKKSTTLFSRRPRDITAEFPSIARAVSELPGTFVIDGEIVALDKAGRPSFQLLQNYRQQSALYYYVFDLLNLNDRDITGAPLKQRKQWLQELAADAGDPIRFSAAFSGECETMLAEARKNQIEGIIAKKAGSIYEPGRRSRNWLKIKIVNEQEFVIGGYTKPKGVREHFGAILVGYYENKQLRFASKVGTGYNSESLEMLYRKFQPLKASSCPFVDISSGEKGLGPAALRRCTWLQPELVCQIKFTEWTSDGGLRHPVFMGLRDDKKATEVVRETPS